MHKSDSKRRCRLFLVIPLCAVLAGCSLTPLQSDFSCAYKDGKACLSMTEADQKIQDPTASPSEKTSRKKCCDADVLPAFSDYPDFVPNPPFPKRRPDVVKRLWLAPFEDIDHNWHAASYVYTVDRPAHWVPLGVAVPKNLSVLDPDKAVPTK